MRRIRELAGVVAMAAACAGCGYASAPAWLPEPRALDRWPYGAAVSMRTVGAWRVPVRGELLALQGDSVYVLTTAGPRSVACRQVTELRVLADRRGRLPAPSLFLPRGGIPADRPLPEKWKRIAPFARFPGGLPDSLDLSTLRLPPVR